MSVLKLRGSILPLPRRIKSAGKWFEDFDSRGTGITYCMCSQQVTSHHLLGGMLLASNDLIFFFFFHAVKPKCVKAKSRKRRLGMGHNELLCLYKT